MRRLFIDHENGCQLPATEMPKHAQYFNSKNFCSKLPIY